MKSRLMLLFFLISNSMQSQVTDPSMVLIPAGEFTMGKNSPNVTDWQPEHKVSVDAFYMDKCEVTNSQYYEFCTKTNTSLPEFWGSSQFKCSLEYPDNPVVGVTFYDAMKYAQWAGKRLPTEAEWEYAARGALSDCIYPWGNQIDSTYANYGKKYKTTLKVGSFKPNGYGLFDMSGNVWEWTMDNYKDDYYANSPNQNPKGPAAGRFKVIRGGSWHSGAMCNQTYYRNGLPPSWIDFGVGFRCVKNTK
jgi:formylglycine-generating enzyme